MARKRQQKTPSVFLRVTTSFNGLYAGDTAVVTYDETVRGWERAGLVKVIADVGVSSSGTGTTRQSSALTDDPGSVKD